MLKMNLDRCYVACTLDHFWTQLGEVDLYGGGNPRFWSLFTERATRALRCPGLSDTLRISKPNHKVAKRAGSLSKNAENLLCLSTARELTTSTSTTLQRVQREKRAADRKHATYQTRVKTDLGPWTACIQILCRSHVALLLKKQTLNSTALTPWAESPRYPG